MARAREYRAMLTAFGALAVTIMMVAYARERRAPIWILVFAAACAASSLYGWLARAYPFGIVELVWAVIAYRRWLAARKTPPTAAMIAPPDAADTAAIDHSPHTRRNPPCPEASTPPN